MRDAILTAVIRYVETFFRHKIVVLLPLVLALAVGLGYEIAQPETYQSRVSMWFDVASTTTPSPVLPVSDTGPSAEEVAVIKELLSTDQFTLAVARRGPFAGYIASHPQWQSGLAAIPGLQKLFGNTGETLDARAASAVVANVTVVSSGPHVVTITVSGPTPAVAAGTAQALVGEFSDQVLASRQQRAHAAVDYDNALIKAAQTAVADAARRLSQYEVAHPSASVASDPTEASLGTSLDLAQQRYDSLLGQYNQATLDLQRVADQSGFRVMDQPSAATAAVGAKKRIVLGGVAGLIVGLVIAGLILVALTVLDRTARRADDTERIIGLEVIGTVGRHRSKTSQRSWRKGDGSTRRNPPIAL